MGRECGGNEVSATVAGERRDVMAGMLAGWQDAAGRSRGLSRSGVGECPARGTVGNNPAAHCRRMDIRVKVSAEREEVCQRAMSCRSQRKKNAEVAMAVWKRRHRE